MEIRRFVSDLLASNTYVIAEDGFALAIDPARDLSPARGLRIEKILLTHEHYDHISGVNLWKEATGAPVLCADVCAGRLTDPKLNLARYFHALCVIQTRFPQGKPPATERNYVCSAEETFADTLVFPWRGHEVSLFSLPGHSPGSVGILLDGRHFFSGDSLLQGGAPEFRFPGGDRAAWESVSLPRIAALPEDITVYPGHGDPFSPPAGSPE